MTPNYGHIPMMYSTGTKSSIFCFALSLPQILVNFQNQRQIWNLLVLTFSKHPLHVQFDQVLPEIFEVKDIWCHSFIFLFSFLWFLLRSQYFVLKAINYENPWEKIHCYKYWNSLDSYQMAKITIVYLSREFW